MTTTRRLSGMPQQSNHQQFGVMLDSYEAFRKKHQQQNKEIIAKNTELHKTNADLLHHRSLIQAQNLSLKGTLLHKEAELLSMRDKLYRLEQSHQYQQQQQQQQLQSCSIDPEQVEIVRQALVQAVTALGSLIPTSSSTSPASPVLAAPRRTREIPQTQSIKVSLAERPGLTVSNRLIVSEVPELSLIDEHFEPEEPIHLVPSSPLPLPLPIPTTVASTTLPSIAKSLQPRSKPKPVAVPIAARLPPPATRHRVQDEPEDELVQFDDNKPSEEPVMVSSRKKRPTGSSGNPSFPVLVLQQVEDSLQNSSERDRGTTTGSSEEAEKPVARSSRRKSILPSLVTGDTRLLPDDNDENCSPPPVEKRRGKGPLPAEVEATSGASSSDAMSLLQARKESIKKEKDRVKSLSPTSPAQAEDEQEAERIQSKRDDHDEPRNDQTRASLASMTASSLCLSIMLLNYWLRSTEPDEVGTGSRRARKSVNYALPKLNTKMRRPADYVPVTSSTQSSNASSSSSSSTHPNSKPRKSTKLSSTSSSASTTTAEGLRPSHSTALPSTRRSSQEGDSDIPSLTTASANTTSLPAANTGVTSTNRPPIPLVPRQPSLAGKIKPLIVPNVSSQSRRLSSIRTVRNLDEHDGSDVEEEQQSEEDDDEWNERVYLSRRQGKRESTSSIRDGTSGTVRGTATRRHSVAT
ncbi:shugoshin family protein [Sporobolomyces koalae]|uniref:shugoshin family protein n=1 Tax=Sporobolomyces koalae TaxID=500713 RepID=UPI00317A0C73